MSTNHASVTVSSPGKLMLLGEHAVVYNRPCLVTAVGQRMKAEVSLNDDGQFQLTAPDVNLSGYKKPMARLGKGDIPKAALFVELAVKNFAQRFPLNTGVSVITSSEFSSQFGFGSSSASAVCIIKALSELTHKKLSDALLFDLSYKAVLAIQGKGSGFDVAAAIYGGTLYFITGGEIIRPIPLPSLPLIIGYSGEKADTVSLINQVKKKQDKYPGIIDSIYTNIETLVELAKKALIKQDWQTVGELMNINQGFLEALGVGSIKLNSLIYAARENGAYGAKLSGAGGGDCMIALAGPDKTAAVKEAITQAGGRVLTVDANAQGVRNE